MATDINFKKTSDFISSHLNEAVKLYHTYDGSNRLEYVYTAIWNAGDNESCLRTQYAYDGASTRVIKMQESLSTWDATWDI